MIWLRLSVRLYNSKVRFSGFVPTAHEQDLEFRQLRWAVLDACAWLSEPTAWRPEWIRLHVRVHHRHPGREHDVGCHRYAEAVPAAQAAASDDGCRR